MADLQEPGGALGAIIVHGEHFYRWAPDVVSCSRAVPVVPLSVAEGLAAALEKARRLLPHERPEWGGDPSWLANDKRLIAAALAAFRAVVPRANGRPSDVEACADD